MRRPVRAVIEPMILAHRVSPPLASYVESIWLYDGERGAATHRRERVLPNGRFQTVINLASGRGAVSGLRSHYVEMDPDAIASIAGVVFRPGGSRPFFDQSASDFYNQIVPLDAVWGSQAVALGTRLGGAPTAAEKFRLIEGAFVSGMKRAADRRLTLHPSVEYALQAFRRAPHVQTVVHLSAAAGLSRRRFTELFREQVGMTPKRYCRLLRFRGVVRRIAAAAPVDWVDVALAGGYCDQAHLSHEFRDFSGMSPSSYLAAERPFVNHVRV